MLDGVSNVVGWRYILQTDNSTENYDANGLLVSVVTSAGLRHMIARDADGRVTTVSDDFGRQLVFTYDAIGRGHITKMTAPGNQVYEFNYDGSRNLSTVRYPDLTIRTYLYAETANTSGAILPNALTGILDEKNVRFSTYKYNNDGKAISTEHAGGVNKYTVSYTLISATVTDPLLATKTIVFQPVVGVVKPVSVSQPCSTPGCSGTQSMLREHDTNGNVASRTDFNGNTTCSTFDQSRNLETARVQGAASTTACTTALTATSLTAPLRKTSTEWNPNWRLPKRVAEPKRLTTYTFFGDAGTAMCAPAGASTALVCTKTVQETNDATGASGFSATVQGTARSWKWTYDQYGRVLIATDPRNNPTTNDYYANDAAQGTKRGMLKTVTNAAGHVTTITSYNATGQPLSMTDANGLISTMTYDPRQRMKSRTVGSEITLYDYDGVGQLTKLTLPDNSVLNYGYDGAHRLFKISDGADIDSGNTITYTLDNMGNRVEEYARDPAGVLVRKQKREIDLLNRLWKTYTGADASGFGNPTTHTYDANGNLKTTTDPLMRVTTNNYDALNRLKEVIDPFNGATLPTKYEYDAQDNLKKVADPRNSVALETNYNYSGFNELTDQTSPDTGLTSFSYVGGNLDTKTDARNVQATYTYDVLNRIYTIAYPAYQTDPAETVTYTYDTCSNGKGRLCSITDKTGTTSFSYDLNGRQTSKTQTVGGIARTVTNSYNNTTGQLDSMTLPSGVVVSYTYVNGRVDSVRATLPGTVGAQAIATAIGYHPFGPASQWTWGNSTLLVPNKHIRSFDLDGRISKIEPAAAIDPTKYGFDDASNINSITRLIGTTPDASRGISYGYDSLDRLKTQTPNAANTTAGTLNFSLDAIGNRITSATGGIVPPSRSNQTLVISYGGNNRPISYATAGIGTMLVSINALGQRVKKSVGTANTTFIYGDDGQLVGEYDGVGNNMEHIWLGGMPIAAIRSRAIIGQAEIFYVHADHLGTPRAITSATGGGVVWTWDNNDPFGDNAVNERPSAVAGTLPFRYNLRFPGQYFDQETNTHYNYFRDYDAATGRYIQSDPIGLAGGINMYSYVQGNPLSFIDPTGLMGYGGGARATNPSGGGSCVCQPSSSVPTPQQAGDILGRSMAGGAGIGAVGGATFGVAAGVAEGAHLGALGGLAVADATFGGAVAGTVVGGALGVGVGGLVIGGVYVANRFGTSPVTSSRPGNPALTPRTINVCP